MRGIFKWLGGIAVALAVVWAGLWGYAQNRLQAALRDYATAHTAADGSLSLTYDRITGGGFPFSATATMTNPTLTRQLPGGLAPGAVSVTADYATLRLGLLPPLHLRVELPGKIVVHLPQGEGVITYASFVEIIRLNQAALFTPRAAAVTGTDTALTNINLLASSGSLQLLHLDKLSFHATLRPDANASQTGLTLAEDFQGLALPGWLTQLLHAPFGGQVAHLGLDLTLSGPLDWQELVRQLNMLPSGAAREKALLDALHGWASQGGSGSGKLSLTAGPSTMSAAGTARFDAKAQPSGTADITADHMDAFGDAVTAAYPALQTYIASTEAQLAPYISASATNGQILAVHLLYGPDGVVANGKRVGDMPKLDWDGLLSPPQSSGQ